MDEKLLWDPVGENPRELISRAGVENEKLVRSFDDLQKNPSKVRVRMLLFCLLTVAIWVILYFIYFYSNTSFSGDDGEIFFYAIIPPLIYYYKIKQLEKNLTQMLIAKEYNWLYNSKEDKDKWQLLKRRFREIFNQGNKGQFVSEQIWGDFDNGKTKFWMAKFEYDSGGGRSSSIVDEMIYAFKLPRQAAHTLVLRPRSFFNRLEERLRKTLSTEWNEFNNTFHLEYEGRTNDVGANVLRVLTPTAMEKLVQLKKEAGYFEILFLEDVMIVSFRGEFKLKYTNFFKKIALDTRDKEIISQKLTKTIDLADDILPCLD